MLSSLVVQAFLSPLFFFTFFTMIIVFTNKIYAIIICTFTLHSCFKIWLSVINTIIYGCHYFAIYPDLHLFADEERNVGVTSTSLQMSLASSTSLRMTLTSSTTVSLLFVVFLTLKVVDSAVDSICFGD